MTCHPPYRRHITHLNNVWWETGSGDISYETSFIPNERACPYFVASLFFFFFIYTWCLVFSVISNKSSYGSFTFPTHLPFILTSPAGVVQIAVKQTFLSIQRPEGLSPPHDFSLDVSSHPEIKINRRQQCNLTNSASKNRWIPQYIQLDAEIRMGWCITNSIFLLQCHQRKCFPPKTFLTLDSSVVQFKVYFIGCFVLLFCSLKPLLKQTDVILCTAT